MLIKRYLLIMKRRRGGEKKSCLEFSLILGDVLANQRDRKPMNSDPGTF